MDSDQPVDGVSTVEDDAYEVTRDANREAEVTRDPLVGMGSDDRRGEPSKRELIAMARKEIRVSGEDDEVGQMMSDLETAQPRDPTAAHSALVNRDAR